MLEAGGRGLKARWVSLRNRILADPRFQHWAAGFPLLAAVSRSRARQLFDLIAGFTYSQIVAASIESGLLEHLSGQGIAQAELGPALGLSPAATDRLLRAASSIGIAEEAEDGWWMLGQQGAVLHANKGAQAMVRHHALLYRDLADPLALLRNDRRTATRLANFWTYAPQASQKDEARAYSDLMAESQAMVTDAILTTYRFTRHRKLLDVGGGHGVFAEALAKRYAHLEVGVFDLPAVIEGARERTFPRNVRLHEGSFFDGALPSGYDCISLVRILHDHDDDQAIQILKATRSALPAGGTLIIAEPMSSTPGAQAMGDAYFGLYLWAMGSGRPRRPEEIMAMLKEVGFNETRLRQSRQPIVTSLLVSSC